MASAAGLDVIPDAYGAPAVHFAAAPIRCPLVEHLTLPVWARGKSSAESWIRLEPQVGGGKVALAR